MLPDRAPRSSPGNSGGGSPVAASGLVHARREKWVVSAGLSLGLHLCGSLALALAPTTPRPPAPALSPATFTIDVTPPPERPTRPEPRPPSPIERPSRPVMHPPPRRTDATPTPAPSPAEPGPTPIAPLVPDVLVEEEDRIDRPTISLDPALHAARQTFEGPGPTMPGRPASLEDDSPDRRPTPIGEAIATLQGSLALDANARPYSERPYVVVQRPDGAYHYEGIGFEGIIEPDGSVHFSDRPDLSARFGGSAAEPSSASPHAEQLDPTLTIASGSFDLTDAIMRGAGQDPYMSERLGFLDATEELRERLEDEARAASGVRSLRRLRGRLAILWQDETRSLASRRRAIFELWDQQADGEEGAPARDVVIAFIREERSLGSDIVYGELELARLNATRTSADPFAP
jgi:hypothetical protein